VQAFATKSIALVPKDTTFAFAVPKSQEPRLQKINALEDTDPASEKYPAGLIKFDEADLIQVLEIYQELAGRTVLLATSTPRLKISMRSQTEWTRLQAIRALETVVGLGDVAIFPHQTKFAIVQPSSFAEPPKEFVSNQSAVETIEAEVNRDGGLSFRDISPEAFLQRYAVLCGREPLPIESNLPQSRFTIRSQSLLTGAEAIYALDSLAVMKGFRVVLVGDKQVKLVRGE
jgi:hypothetical protein